MILKEKTALITGAAGGIGRAIAVALAMRGCHVIITDIDAAGLEETERLCAKFRVRIERFRLDVSNADEINRLAQLFSDGLKPLDILINNAGVALGGEFEQTADADFEWLFSINFWGTVRMCRAFLPLLKRSSDARIVNLSSLFGIIAPPGQTAYAASKFAVRGFSLSLARELESSNVAVSVVHPGGVATSIAKNARVSASLSRQEFEERLARYHAALKLPPEKAGDTIVRAMEKRKSRIVVGTDALSVVLLERLFPVSYWSFLRRLYPK